MVELLVVSVKNVFLFQYYELLPRIYNLVDLLHYSINLVIWWVQKESTYRVPIFYLISAKIITSIYKYIAL